MNVKVGQVAEYFDDTVIVTAVYPAGTMDVNYTRTNDTTLPMVGEAPIGFLSRPQAELVDMGNGRVIWNHE